jgi:hypothetical protein
MSRALVKNVLSKNGYVQLNKAMIKEVGLHAAAILAFLIDKEDLWYDMNSLQEDGSFYWVVEEIEEELSLSRKERETAIKILKEKNLLKVSLRGLPKRNFYLIEWDAIISVLSTSKKPNNIHSVLPRYRQECTPGTDKSVPPVQESKNIMINNLNDQEEIIQVIPSKPEATTPTTKEIINSWSAGVSKKFEDRLNCLLELASLLKANGYRVTDISKREEATILAPWALKPKHPKFDSNSELSQKDWQTACGTIWTVSLTPEQLKAQKRAKIEQEFAALEAVLEWPEDKI